MAVNYIAELHLTCDTIAEFNKQLADAQAAPTISNIVSDASALTIDFTITVINH